MFSNLNKATESVTRVLYAAAVVLGFVLLIDVVASLDYVDFGTPRPDQPGFQTYTIAHVALRLGVAACFFLAAIALRPRGK